MFKKSRIALILSFFIILLMLPGAIVKADTIEDLPFGVTVNGSITASTVTNIYKIVLPSAGRLDLNIMSEIYDVNAWLDDTKGNHIMFEELNYGSEHSPNKWNDSADLEAGTYYIRLSKRDTNLGKYTVLANFTPININDFEPNNSTETAQLLDLNKRPIIRYLSSSDDVDFYKITIPKSDYIYININSYIDSLIYELYDSKNNRLGFCNLIKGQDQEYSACSNGEYLTAGATYYLKIYQNSSCTGKYTLKVDCNSAVSNLDQIYANAYNATVNAMNVKTQNSIYEARKAIEKLRYTEAEWAIGEFSKQVDNVQHAILVILVDRINKAWISLSQLDINDARDAIDPDFPAYWKCAYSSEVDKIQQKLMQELLFACDKAASTKLKQDIDYANALIADVKKAKDQSIVDWANTVEKEFLGKLTSGGLK